MKNLSLFQVIFTGVFVVGGLIGLFVFSTYTGGVRDDSGIGNVVVWGILPKAEVQEAISSIVLFNESLKGVSYVEKNVHFFESDLASAIATGSGPDLLLISHEQLLSLRELLQPIPASSLPTRTFQSSFVDAGLLFAAPTGFYGVPVLVDPLVLFFNRSILSSGGIATPPTTWEAMTGLIPKVTALSSSGAVTRALIALGSYDNITSARGILSALFLQTRVPLVTTGSSGGLVASLGNQSSGGGVLPGEAVLRFYTQFADPNKLSYTWNASLPESERAFQVGDLALYLGYASRAGFLRQANPNLNFDVAPLPQATSATTKTTYGLLYAFALPRGSKNAAGGLSAAYLLSGVNGGLDETQTLARSTGLAPASRAALGQGTNDPILSIAYASALYAKGWLSPAPRSTDQVFSAMISNVTSGRLTLSAALTAAERSLTALLQQ